MRRSVLAVCALTASATLAAVSALPATAAPHLPRGSVAAATTTRPRPVAPPAFHRAALAAAAAGRAHLRFGTPVAAGVRPIGAGVSTDLPTRVEIGADLVRVPYTVVVPTSSIKDPGVEIGLVVGNGTGLVLDSFTVGTAGQTVFRGAVSISAGALKSFGQGAWVVAYGSVSADKAMGAATGTTVKIRSLLAESLTRQGNRVRVVGAAKVFDGAGAYVGRPGVRVGVDRYTGNGHYVSLATATTDRLGHLDVTVGISFRAGIRLTDADTGQVFGAFTPIGTI